MSATTPGDNQGSQKGARQPTQGGGKAGSQAPRPDVGDPPSNTEFIERLDAFLDDLAIGHRTAMEDVVRWLEKHGSLEEEIRTNVEALNPLFQKWSFEICFLLRLEGQVRFNRLKTLLGGIGSRTLSHRLKELEAQGLVHREVYPEVPVRVEYSLTPKGMRFGDLIMPVIAHLRIWDMRKR